MFSGRSYRVEISPTKAQAGDTYGEEREHVDEPELWVSADKVFN